MPKSNVIDNWCKVYNISSAATTVIVNSGPGFVWGVEYRNPTAAATINLYDTNISAATATATIATRIGQTINMPTAVAATTTVVKFPNPVYCSTGIRCTVSAPAKGKVSIFYR